MTKFCSTVAICTCVVEIEIGLREHREEEVLLDVVVPVAVVWPLLVVPLADVVVVVVVLPLEEVELVVVLVPLDVVEAPGTVDPEVAVMLVVTVVLVGLVLMRYPFAEMFTSYVAFSPAVNSTGMYPQYEPFIITSPSFTCTNGLWPLVLTIVVSFGFTMRTVTGMSSFAITGFPAESCNCTIT